MKLYRSTSASMPRTLFIRLSRVLALLISCVVYPFVLSPVAITQADDVAPSRKITEADLPRTPHTDAADVLKTFQLARDFELEVVAAEPLVSDPVDACFDEYGRMYVAEMHGYPFSHEPTTLNPAGGGKKDAGVIRLLEDADGDGRMDRSHGRSQRRMGLRQGKPRNRGCRPRCSWVLP